MNNILKNKKVLIPVIIAFVVIIIAIVIFAFMGISEKNNKKGDSKIKFSGDETSENTTKDTSNNTNKNTVKNEVKDDDEIGEGIDEFYKDAIKKFIAGYMDKDDMETFLEDCVDVKAYLAYDNIDGDDSKFLEEYSSIDDNDEKIEKVKDTFMQMPQAYKSVLLMIEAFSKMGDSLDENENTIDNTSDNNLGDVTKLTDEDKEMKLIDIEEPIKSNEDDAITSIVAKISFLGEESEITMVFYDEIVIYITNEDGESIIDAVKDSNNNSNGNFSFNGEITEDDINILEE